jgi:hypothetical protein
MHFPQCPSPRMPCIAPVLLPWPGLTCVVLWLLSCAPPPPQAYFSKWGQTGVVDLKDVFSKLIALTAARTLLGREIREQLFDQVSRGCGCGCG